MEEKCWYDIPSNEFDYDELGNVVPSQIYTVKLVLFNGVTTMESSCDCKHGSFYRFSEKNKLNHWKCKHIIAAEEKYKNGDKGGLHNEEVKNIKPIQSIFD